MVVQFFSFQYRYKPSRHYGIPSKIIELITAFYLEFNCSIGSSSDACFIVKSGVRQGCVMSPLLFILAIDWVMKSTHSSNNTGIGWTLFTSLEDLDYADDLALLSHLEKHMQSKTSKLQSNAEKNGLKINTKKTEVMSLNTKQPARIQVDGNNLSNTTTFTYLSSIVTSDGGADKDIKARLSKARGAVISFKNIWKTNDISRWTKIRIYNSCVLSVLLYGAECWRMTEGDICRLSSFRNGCLREIMRIFWPNKITNVELHEKANTDDDMRTLLTKRRWRC